jgi:hypothetical protein
MVRMVAFATRYPAFIAESLHSSPVQNSILINTGEWTDYIWDPSQAITIDPALYYSDCVHLLHPYID